MSDGLYSRQSKLNLKEYNYVIVVGVGGIGNWVALDLALSGCVHNLIIIDPDEVEESNLNRTFFDYSDIGCYKVDCVSKHITLRRPEQKIYICREYMTENLAQKILETHFKDNSYYHDNFAIIDCRDDVYDDCYMFNCKLYKVGYDGMSITIDGNPRLTKVFGQRGGSYTVIPSYIGSAQLAAILVCNDLLYPRAYDIHKNEPYCDTISIIKDSLEREDFPYLHRRVCHEYDEWGRLNDTVNIECVDIIEKFVEKPTKYISPNGDFSNLPNNIVEEQQTENVENE